MRSLREQVARVGGEREKSGAVLGLDFGQSRTTHNILEASVSFLP